MFMKKLFGSYFPWMRSMKNFPAMNTGEFALRDTAGLVKLRRQSMAVLLGAVLLGFLHQSWGRRLMQRCSER